MTHVCCPSCALRFTPADAAYLSTCPECGGALEPLTSAEQALGFRLFSDDEPDALAQAIAMALPRHRPGTEPS